MEVNKKTMIVIIFSIVIILSLLMIVNRMVSMQMNEVDEILYPSQNTLNKSKVEEVITQAKVPVIDPLNDPLAPRKKKKKIKEVPVKEENTAPAKKYEFSVKNPVLVQ